MLFKTYVLLVLFKSCSILAIGPLHECSLDVVSSDEARLPLLFYNYSTYLELTVPEKGKVKLIRAKRITLACTGKNNVLTSTNTASTFATCDSGDTLIIGYTKQQFSNIKCKKAIRGDVVKTQQKCGQNQGLFTYIGYQVTPQDWVPLIKVCYDDNTGVTLYTEHTLYEDAIAYASRSKSHRPTFSTEGLGPTVAANVAYMQAFQKSTFSKLLGATSIAENYINSASYLARGHLSPDADFFSTATQSSTYYFINACPQWQVINNGNWKSLETTIRKASAKSTLTIVTGTHGVLALPDKNNQQREIFLVSGDKLPVPKYIWKIVYNEYTRMGIVFVVLNNPFVTFIMPGDVFCANICNSNGWGSNSWSDPKKGFLFCCDLNDFQRVVKTAPSFRYHSILQG